MRTLFRNGTALVGNRFAATDVAIETNGSTSQIGSLQHGGSGATVFDASGLLILPGIIDIHGDAFERQLEPRPGVRFDTDLAMLETDRQIIANGITTAYHGVTWSWEPGLRGPEMAREILSTIERLRPRLAADTRFHLRHETFNLEAEAEIIDWLAAGRVGCLAFNDHMSGTIKNRHRPDKMARMVERSGLSEPAFQDLVGRVWSRRDEVPASIARLAAAAEAAGVPALSHDDMSPEQRSWFRALNVTISEFPTTVAATEATVDAGEMTVFGAPNVVRGGSHTGCPAAADMVSRGLCSILASDYYYPALLLAPFRLADSGAATLEQAWRLIAGNPAAAMGLNDRGEIATGKRADLIAVDAADTRMPKVIATMTNGRISFLADGARLGRGDQ